MAETASVGRLHLGCQGFEVSAQGLGCMGMSFGYGPPKPEEEMISLIRHAVSKGITFLDTAEFYGPFTNEVLVGKAIKGVRRDKVQIATKFGFRIVDGKPQLRGDPANVRAACEGSLKRLDVDCIDLYYQHRIDTKVPIEVTMGEMKKLVEEGKIKYIGLSEASASTIRRAHAVHPITAVQLEWSLWSRDAEAEIIPTCRELGIGIVPYSPLGRGFFTSGQKLAENMTDSDYRKMFCLYNRSVPRILKTMPRFKLENLEKNNITFERIYDIASKKGCTPGQLALAWIHYQGNDVSPIPGTTKVKNLEENFGALSVNLTQEEMNEIENVLSTCNVFGDRYEDKHKRYLWMNSETPPLSSWKDVK